MLVALDIAGLYFVIRIMRQLKALQTAAQKLAAGDLTYTVDTEKMYPVLKEHGDNLNAVSVGMSRAVNERMKSERFKTELITNVSHDLKTPLTSIVSYVDLLKKEPTESEAAREYIEVLDRQSQKLKKLTTDLVDASKASSGALPVNLEKIDLGELLRQSAILARQYHVRLHTHLCETRDEENYMLEREGMRPLAFMQTLGWVGPDVWYAHGIHFNTEELKLLAETGTGVCHCPISNMKLASGIARIPEMLKLGVPVGLGVDGSASNDGSSLMEELRVAFLLHRLNSSREAPSGYDFLKMATCGSAKLLGRDDIGSLATGKCCDLFLIDSRRMELTGACYDPKSVLATVGVRGPVDYTVVHGNVTVKQGRLATIDEEKAARDAQAVCDKYLNM